MKPATSMVKRTVCLLLTIGAVSLLATAMVRQRENSGLQLSDLKIGMSQDSVLAGLNQRYGPANLKKAISERDVEVWFVLETRRGLLRSVGQVGFTGGKLYLLKESIGDEQVGPAVNLAKDLFRAVYNELPPSSDPVAAKIGDRYGAARIGVREIHLPGLGTEQTIMLILERTQINIELHLKDDQTSTVELAKLNP